MKPAPKPWTDADRDLLRRLYPDMPPETLCRIFKRTRASINQMARKLDLGKTAAYHKQYSNRFQPGHQTWNAGMKGWQAGGRSAETRFKAGLAPSEASNYRPIGSVRTSKEGYLERKWTDDKRLYPSARWKSLHLELWEQHHGPVPAGHAICFINGDMRDIRIENLECITRAELMARNTVHNMPKELAELCQLRGALNRKINEKRKSA